MGRLDFQEIEEAVALGRADLQRVARQRAVRERRRWIEQTARAQDVPNLDDFLKDAVDAAPYYARAMEGYDRFSLTDFPVLRKRDIRENFADLLARHPDGRVVGSALTISRTSGSTGSPVATLHGLDDEYLEYTLVRRMYDDLGLRSGDLWDLGLRGAREPLLQAEPLLLQGLQWNLPRYKENDPYSQDIYRALLELSKPELLLGVSSLLVTLAKHCEHAGVFPRPRAVIASYEYLSGSGRELLAQVFDAPVRMLYGTTETGLCAWECPYGNLHYDPLVVPEVLDAYGKPTPAGVVGRLVITSMMTSTMPVIRYETGDLASRITDCQCGRETVATTKLEGRDAQPLWGREWVEFSPYPVLAELSKFGLTDFQIIQKDRGVATIVVDEVMGRHAEQVLQHLSVRLPPPVTAAVRFTVEPSGDFLLTSSGKRNPMVQNAQPPGEPQESDPRPPAGFREENA